MSKFKGKSSHKRSSLKRDVVLLALASGGDLAIEALFKLSMLPIALVQINQHAWDYGMGGDPHIDSGDDFGQENGLFRSIVEFRNYIASLRRQGLVVRGESGYVRLTVMGHKLAVSDRPFSFLKRYSINIDSPKVLVMVIFDIPEKHRRRRDWLRFHLKNLGFRLIQASVWLGPTALPEAFVKDIKMYGMDQWVHIFPLDRTGTISPLIQRFGFE